MAVRRVLEGSALEAAYLAFGQHMRGALVVKERGSQSTELMGMQNKRPPRRGRNRDDLAVAGGAGTNDG